MPSATNSSTASAARPTASATIVALVRLEPRQHVIREIAPGIAAPDADPQPCKLSVPSCSMIDLRPLCPPADPAARARSRPARDSLVHDDEQVGELDLVELQQPADRVRRSGS